MIQICFLLLYIIFLSLFFFRVYGLAVRRLLEEYGLKSEEIKGTGRPNRLLKSDVLTYIQTKNIKKVAPKTGM